MHAGRRWLDRPHDELGAVPLHMALEDWRGLVRVLRLLEATWPGCSDYEPGSAPFLIGCRSDSLLRKREAEHGQAAATTFAGPRGYFS
jgi:hypothetical protein